MHSIHCAVEDVKDFFKVTYGGPLVGVGMALCLIGSVLQSVKAHLAASPRGALNSKSQLGVLPPLPQQTVFSPGASAGQFVAPAYAVPAFVGGPMMASPVCVGGNSMIMAAVPAPGMPSAAGPGFGGGGVMMMATTTTAAGAGFGGGGMTPGVSM